MELRVLRYFVEVAREGNMTRAAGRLHVTQPTLSKQLKDLEDELGKKLFVRSNYRLNLTDEGLLLLERASDILDLVRRTEGEFRAFSGPLTAEVHLGCAESYLIAHLARIIRDFRQEFPGLHFHITSGTTEQVTERLDRGLLDFGIIVEPPEADKYLSLEIPGEDEWGLIMRRDHPLAARDGITIDDLKGLELICSEQSVRADLPRWCGRRSLQLNLIGSTNLCYNGSVCVREGLGCLLAFNHLADTGDSSPLCFRPLRPRLVNRMYFIYRRNQHFSPLLQQLLEIFEQRWGGAGSGPAG